MMKNGQTSRRKSPVTSMMNSHFFVFRFWRAVDIESDIDAIDNRITATEEGFLLPPGSFSPAQQKIICYQLRQRQRRVPMVSILSSSMRSNIVIALLLMAVVDTVDGIYRLSPKSDASRTRSKVIRIFNKESPFVTSALGRCG